MPTFSNPNDKKSRYRSLQQTRNSPQDDDEKAYRDMEISAEVDRILNKFEGEPEFQKQLSIALAKRTLNLTDNNQGEQ
jgi:hypothetical protein